MPRPRGGDWLEEEIQGWRRSGVDVVVSLLTPDEIADLSLADEAELCRANGIEFFTFPITDRGVPSSKEAFADLLTRLADQLTEGKKIAVHCRQGIGRAALVAICLLTLSGITPESAIQTVSTARGCPVPETTGQRQWIADFVAAARVGHRSAF
jgi:protein-tyrosine phosphatase